MTDTTTPAIDWARARSRWQRGPEPCRDGRGAAARKLRSVTAGLLKELGASKLNELPASEQGVIARVAACQVEFDAMTAARVEGVDMPSEDFIRCTHSHERAIAAFQTLKAKYEEKRKPSLADLLASRTTQPSA